MSISPRVHERDLSNHEDGPVAKKAKVVEAEDNTFSFSGNTSTSAKTPAGVPDELIDNLEELAEDQGSFLPPSHALLGTSPPLQTDGSSMARIMEADVGISEYIAKGVPKIDGIIKQRSVPSGLSSIRKCGAI
jgi:tRNA pseudouridine13 synthase